MSKGGSQTTSVEIPEYIQEAAKRNLTKAEKISQLGYVPYYGPDVAAFSPLQEAAMTNVGGQAGAFGLATPAGGAMAGMPAAQEFAGGVRGYSSAPMFEQAQAELAARRPAQKAYIDSFFIDPVTGQLGSNAAAPIDYTTAFPQTPVAPVSPDTGGGGGGGTYTGPVDDAGVPAPYLGPDRYDPSGLDNFLTQDEYDQAVSTIQDETGYTDYDPQTDVIYGTEYQDAYTASDAAQEAADTIYMNQQQIYGEPTGNQVTSLVTGGYTGGGGGSDMTTQIQKEADAYAASGKTFDMNDPSTWSDPTSSSKVGTDAGDGMVWAKSSTSNALVRVPEEKSSGSSGGGGGGGGGSSSGGSDCVIATHAVASGGFTPSMKREAVVWCMNVLHDKWWGEAIRRGYRHLGSKKIEQGKAHEHYAEFREYIAFANGKERTLKGALTFAYRTAQFFAVGLVKKDA
jgi:hypothetical protein